MYTKEERLEIITLAEKLYRKGVVSHNKRYYTGICFAMHNALYTLHPGSVPAQPDIRDFYDNFPELQLLRLSLGNPDLNHDWFPPHSTETIYQPRIDGFNFMKNLLTPLKETNI